LYPEAIEQGVIFDADGGGEICSSLRHGRERMGRRVEGVGETIGDFAALLFFLFFTFYMTQVFVIYVSISAILSRTLTCGLFRK
jgi:hypothetical protein